jgi:dihydroorotate dehydrogenase (fumarate)
MSVDLSTTWLGLKLDSPLIAGASPLSDDLDAVKRAVDAGASAVVTQSLFEEQFTQDQLAMHSHTESVRDSFGEALSFFPDYDDRGLGPAAYLDHLASLKRAVSVPVIGSLNGITPGGWVRYAREMQTAGADALELNVYYVATDPTEPPGSVEQRYLDILAGVCDAVTIPVAMKLGPFFSSPGHFAKRLVDAGAKGLVMFNRFYQPDIDIEELEVSSSLHLSDPGELLLRIRWVAALYGRVDADLCVTGGVHDAEGAIKGLMAGANAVQMASALLRNGPEHIGTVRNALESWLVDHEYESVQQMVGSMSLKRSPDPTAFSRANYRRILGTWHKY